MTTESELLISRSIKNNPDEKVSLSFSEPISEEEIFMILKNESGCLERGCLEDERPDL